MSSELPDNILPQIIGDNRRDITIATSTRWVYRSVFGGDSRHGIWNPHKYSSNFLLIDTGPSEILFLFLFSWLAQPTSLQLLWDAKFQKFFEFRAKKLKFVSGTKGWSWKGREIPADLKNRTRVVNVSRKMLRSCSKDRSTVSLPQNLFFLSYIVLYGTLNPLFLMEEPAIF